MEISLLTLALVVGVLVLAYRYYNKNAFYFADKPIPFLKPVFPFGNQNPLMFKQVTIFEHFRNLYDAFPSAKIYGMFNIRQPVYVVRDPELIKQITVKDFDHFADHATTGLEDSGSDVLFANSLVSLRGQKWRDMRATLSPAFTGSKMRIMFELIAECGQSMVEHFRAEEAKAKATTGGSGLQLEMKDVMSRFGNDVIGTAAFGIKVDSFRNPENEFIIMARSIMNLQSVVKVAKMMGFALFPKLMARLKIDFLTAEEDRFFRQTIQETMRVREEKGIFRPDMIELLMQAKKGSLKHQQHEPSGDDKKTGTTTGSTTAEGFATVEESQIGRRAHDRAWTDSELIAQAFIFFFAGYETVSWSMSFALYELAVSQDIQQRLREEIDEMEASLADGEVIGYEKLQSMRYMDMVVSETLRKWPFATVLNRECIQDYRCDDGSGNGGFTIEKGSLLLIPFIGMHFDEKYYRQPERFDPERFNEQNRNSIQSGTYFPFGIGPRNCIGSRFALMEVKVVLYYLLKHFHVTPCAKTQIPLKFKKSASQLSTEQGIWVEFSSRAAT
uniref:Putative cytochrome n=1 Tax=Anopheles braziliensis TaxID=58242 RepID=A0A2M3Z6X2_9DIPT